MALMNRDVSATSLFHIQIEMLARTGLIPAGETATLAQALFKFVSSEQAGRVKVIASDGCKSIYRYIRGDGRVIETWVLYSIELDGSRHIRRIMRSHLLDLPVKRSPASTTKESTHDQQ